MVVELDDARARLLSQALNHIKGDDDLGLRAGLVRQMLEALPQEELLAVLPETSESLQALASAGQEDLAEHLRAWEAAQSARLKHLQLQLTAGQLEVVEQALRRFIPSARGERQGNPNVRGIAMFLLCKDYLEKDGELP